MGESVGVPRVSLTARRWTSHDLDAARHTTDLTPSDRIFVNLDIAHHGLGTASCGPDVLPSYRLAARATSWQVLLLPV